MHPEVPTLSFAIGARNDNYSGDSNWRLQTTLNYLAEGLDSLGRLRAAEVVVLDWGSEVPVQEVIPLSAKAAAIVRWVVVEPKLATAMGGDSEFPVVLAQNAAIRRCRGTYIGQMDADILVPRSSLQRVFAWLEGAAEFGAPPERCLAVAQRRHLPWVFARAKPSFGQLDWFVDRLGNRLVGEHSGVPYLGTGLILMHRDLWHECGAFDEALLYRGRMETDLGTRLTRLYPCVLLNHQGVPVYHLSHYTAIHGMLAPRRHNRSRPVGPTNPNEATWGLAEESLSEHAGGQVVASPEVDGTRRTGIVPLSLGILAVIVGGAIRATLPERVRVLPQRGFSTVGTIRLILRGHPVQRWPQVLLGYWRERRRRYQQAATWSAQS